MQTLKLEANALQFTAFATGPQDGPLALCLHGFPDTADSFMPLIEQLASEGYYAVAPFLRGYTPTAVPQDGDCYAITLAQDVFGLLDALGREKATLIGHDWGAMITHAALHSAPERFEKAVTLAIPHPRVIRPNLTLLTRSYHFFTLPLPGAARRLRRSNFRAVEAIVRRWSPTWEIPAGELDPIKKCFAEGGLEGALMYYRCFAAAPFTKKGQRSQKLITRKTEVPTLCILGRDDGALIAGDVAEDTRSAYLAPYQIEVLNNCGHFPHREQPDIVHTLILDFLKNTAE